MKRNFKSLKRPLAMAMAATMIATTIPESVAMAAAAPSVETGASVVVDQEGVAGKPATVTGITIDTTGNYSKYSPVVRWNPVKNAYQYQISVTDAAGNEYFNYFDWDAKKGVYFNETSSYNEFPYAAISYLSGGSTYDADGSYKCDDNGKAMYSMQPGKTYTIKVRAVNMYENVLTEGDWSEPVTYTVGNYTQITDLAYVSADEDYVYFTYNTPVTDGDVMYQVAEDAEFKNIVVSGTNRYNETKLTVYRSGLEANKKYYIRAINTINGYALYDKDYNYANPSNVVEFTAPAEEVKTAKNITGLRVDSEDKDYFRFTFDAVLEEDDGYYLEYSKNQDFTDSNKRYGSTIYKEDMDANTVYYVRAVAYIEGAWDSEEGEYKEILGTPSEVVQIQRNETTAISNLRLKEKLSDSYVFAFDGQLATYDELCVEYSTSADFTADHEITKVWECNADNSEFGIFYTSLTPGETYYVRARVRNTEIKDDPTTMEVDYYSEYTNVYTITTASLPKVAVASSSVTSDSVVLNMNAVGDSDYLTGYEIQKKVGKKWVKLAKITDDSYTDSNLKVDTTYSYRVRPYYYNADKAKTTNGEWVNYSTTTWGSALNLIAAPASKTSVKLTWKKVKGAEGYEVLRRVASSAATEKSEGMDNSYSKYTLVKTIKKGKTVSYTDKKLTSGESYSYMVRAYKTVDGKKYYVQDTDTANLSFNQMVNISKIKRYTNGKVKVTWKPIYTAKGYVVEQYDDKADKWTTYKTINKAKTATITLPASDGEREIYRIRAFKGQEYTVASSGVCVYPYVAAPQKVKAAAQADGSIKVTWNAVNGADYYQVFRTTSSEKMYDKDTKTYSYSAGVQVPVYVADASMKSGYKKLDSDELTGTSLVDTKVAYTHNGMENEIYEGPTAGVTYYYYVVACKNGVAYKYVDDGTTYVSGASKAAKAVATNVSVKKPTLKSVKSTKAGKVTITWKKVSDAEGYEVFRSTKKGSGYVKVGTVTKGKTVKYTDTTAAKGKKYYYKVRAVKSNEAGADTYSSYSSAKKVTVKK